RPERLERGLPAARRRTPERLRRRGRTPGTPLEALQPLVDVRIEVPLPRADLFERVHLHLHVPAQLADLLLQGLELLEHVEETPAVEKPLEPVDACGERSGIAV